MADHICVWITTGVAVEVRDGKIYGGEEQRCYGCDSYLTQLVSRWR